MTSATCWSLNPLEHANKGRVNCDKHQYSQLKTFHFIKTVSDTVLDMINAVYHDKPLILIGATCWAKLVSHHRTVNEASSET